MTTQRGSAMTALAVVLIAAIAAVAYVVLHQTHDGPSPAVGPRHRVGPQDAVTPPGVVTPEQFGADGDGRTDDSEAVQAAVDAGAAGHTTAWLSAGRTYLCSRPISVPSNTTLRGAGSTAVLRFTWSDTTGGRAAYVRSNDQSGGESDIAMSNFSIIGDGSGEPAGLNADNPRGLAPSVQMNNVIDLSITHLEIENSPGISITYRAARDVTISDNYIHNSGRDGITGFWSTDGNISQILIEDNLIARVGDDGIAINGLDHLANRSELPADIQILHNEIRGWANPPNDNLLGRGIAVIGAQHLVAADNLVSNTAGPGIMLVGCSQNFCDAGARDPSTGNGWTSTDLTVVENKIVNAGQIPGALNRGSVQGGIYIDSTRDSLVQDNAVVDAAGSEVNSELCQHCDVQ